MMMRYGLPLTGGELQLYGPSRLRVEHLVNGQVPMVVVDRTKQLVTISADQVSSIVKITRNPRPIPPGIERIKYQFQKSWKLPIQPVIEITGTTLEFIRLNFACLLAQFPPSIAINSSTMMKYTRIATRITLPLTKVMISECILLSITGEFGYELSLSKVSNDRGRAHFKESETRQSDFELKRERYQTQHNKQ
jgi:hypothetical protein